MIVDDHAGVRKLIRQLASRAEDVVRECATGDEAVRVASEFQPDLVTMDVRMPGLCGIEATRAIVTAQPSARVVMVTTHDQPELRQAAREAGAFAYLPKESLAEIRSLVFGAEKASTPKEPGEGARKATDLSAASRDGDKPASSVTPMTVQADNSLRGIPAAGSSTRILLVLMIADNEATDQTVRSALVRHGYAPVIHRVSTGDSVRRALVQARWDVIVTDSLSPDFGAATLSLIRELAGEIPIVRLSSGDGTSPPLNDGARIWVSKDNLTDLGAVMEHVLAQKPVRALQATEDPPPKAAPSVAGAMAAEPSKPAQDYITQIEGRLRELNGYAGTVAHELNAPLRFVRWLSGKLIKEHETQLPADARESLRRIDDSCRKMAATVERLLCLARFDRSGMQIETLSIGSLVAEAWSEVCPENLRPAIDFRAESLPDLPGDRALLRLVFVNLLANALKFSTGRDRPSITVSCSVVGGTAGFAIKDNGVGFDMRHAGQLFRPFQRMHFSPELEGTGLGLATVHRILDQHHGRIWAEAAVGQGAAFYFTLPCRSPGAKLGGTP